MNTFKQAPPGIHAKSHLAIVAVTFVAATLGVSALAGCSGVSDLTKERVSQSSATIRQSEQTLGGAEAGAVELQRAKDHQQAAQNALARANEKDAQQSAALAGLHAQLAVAQSQSAEAKRAAAEVLATTQTLRQESERNVPASR
jgi:hypothetical protein